MAERINVRVKIGEFGVDSGQVLIGDPCYLESGNGWNTEGVEYDQKLVEGYQKSGEYAFNYSGACARTLSPEGAGSIGRNSAVVSTTGYGDGQYPVFATYNADGRVVKLEILFESDEDEDDEDSEETECDVCHDSFEFRELTSVSGSGLLCEDCFEKEQEKE